MKIGTLSLLFGVHQFIWHPITIVCAWRKCYRRWPKWWELVAIVCHDWGYWGCENMDGEEGQRHPEGGAAITCDIVYGLSCGNAMLAYAAWRLSLYHSTHYAATHEARVSDLYLPDKMSVLYDPKWFYLFRGWLSGEVDEYVNNAPSGVSKNGRGYWYDWYRAKIVNKWLQYCLNSGR
jgi:hypothetical protein